LAATRVESPAEREAVVDVLHYQGKSMALFDFVIRFNDKVVFERIEKQEANSKPFRIRKTGNTMLVECRSADDGAVTPGAIHLKFNDAGDGRPVDGLQFDVAKRE